MQKAQKAIFFLILLISLLPAGTFAQMYTNLSLGYGIPEARQTLGANIIVDSAGFSNEAVTGSYGSGLNVMIGGGYYLSDYLSVGLNVNYLLGKKYEFLEDVGNVPETTTSNASSISVIPYISMRTGNEGVYGYARAGINLPVMNKITEETTASGSDLYLPGDSYSFKQKAEWKGGMTPGCGGAVGAGYALSEKIHLTGELFYNSHSIAGKTWEITEYDQSYTFSGTTTTTDLSDLDVAQKQWEFVDEITEDDNNDPDEPAKALTEYAPYSAWGINIGINLRF